MRGMEVADISYLPYRYQVNEHRKRDMSELAAAAEYSMRSGRLEVVAYNIPKTDRGDSRGSETNTHQLKGVGSIRQLT